ncbi:MAG: rhamnulokinase [Prevotella sp.]|nr:rhamnulokinase [Prevotella sp.]
MDNKQFFFAVDLGATSGRTIVGTLSDERLSLEEITRFDNNLIQTGGHFYWDVFALYHEIIKGLRIVAQRQIPITSIGIDTWGVDFVCIGEDNAILRNPLSYRDPHTFGMMEEYFEKCVDKKTVYDTTGIQFMNFNSLFQLFAMRKNENAALKNATKILFVPDCLSFMLTGKQVCEYTIASTSQILDPRTKDLDDNLLSSVGLSRDIFGEMVSPSTVIGTLTEEVQAMTGLKAIPVVAVAGHDTASAVAAVPARDEQFAYLSSGTWSLMGIETQEAIINEQSYNLNFTNEGGIEGTTRFLKNICGMWLYERCRKEWTDAPKSHAVLQAEAMKVTPFQSIINPDDQCFANPTSMVEAIQGYCRATNQHVPEGYAEICRCIFDSLALRYRQVFKWLKEFSTFPINTLHIIGGGSLNEYLDQFTANATGVEVLAGPQEGTAIGNIMLQSKACGIVKDIWEMRKIIGNSIEMKRFVPQDKEQWEAAYSRYLEVTRQ